ncbi:c-type cytochrome [Algoriphagus sp. H41]|uniref:C-type cytochrome n=1 Tax=Algoriphagus oliviformis TaxID=2811231 RepID=A0ABS3C398_9BACT|nr:c-type cytochrome [Algoriphagus oliviformis]MBN7810616.1 c-type cytochrome [Algoriphagus oliviformis]
MKTQTNLATLALFCLALSCNPKDSQVEIPPEKPKKEFYVVPGPDEPFDTTMVQKGKVLIAYSDCYQCHREENKAKGPSFSDIARRYPIQEAYIAMLAQKVIRGGFGVWGYPVMSAHPKLSAEDAEAMVLYILSLDAE